MQSSFKIVLPENRRPVPSRQCQMAKDYNKDSSPPTLPHPYKTTRALQNMITKDEQLRNRFFCIPKTLAARHFRSAHKLLFTDCSCFSRNTVPIGFCCGGFSSTAGYVPGNEAHLAISDFCSPLWWFLAKKCFSFLSEKLGKNFSTFSTSKAFRLRFKA
jgi:hypothetical protein